MLSHCRRHFVVAAILALMGVCPAFAQVDTPGDNSAPNVWVPNKDITSTFSSAPFVGPNFSFYAPDWLHFKARLDRRGHKAYMYMGPMHEGNDAVTVLVTSDTPEGNNPRSTPEKSIQYMLEYFEDRYTDGKFTEPEHGYIGNMPAVRAYGRGLFDGIPMRMILYSVDDKYAYATMMATDSGRGMNNSMLIMEAAAMTLTLHDLPRGCTAPWFQPAQEYLKALDKPSTAGGITLSPPLGYRAADAPVNSSPNAIAGWIPGGPGEGNAPRGSLWFYAVDRPNLTDRDPLDLARTQADYPPDGTSNYEHTAVDLGRTGYGLAARYHATMDQLIDGQPRKVSMACYIFFWGDKLIEADAVADSDDPDALPIIETALLSGTIGDSIAKPKSTAPPSARPAPFIAIAPASAQPGDNSSTAPTPPPTDQPAPDQGQGQMPQSTAPDQGQAPPSPDQTQAPSAGQPAPDHPAPGWAQ